LPENINARGKSASGAAPAGGEPQGESTPERMLEAAAVLFSKKGYAATSTREIATTLGIRKPSLYYHIDTKEDLLYAICKSSLDQIRVDVKAALEKVHHPLERTRVLVRAHISNLARDQARHAATVSEMRALSGDRQAEVIALRDAYEKLVRSVLKGAQVAGVLRKDIPVKYLCLSLLGLLNRVEVWYHRSGPLSPEELARVFETIFLTGAAANRQA
jgi:TetR/AcrR family transcriptional regulator, cholesterol catabolism regulator